MIPYSLSLEATTKYKQLFLSSNVCWCMLHVWVIIQEVKTTPKTVRCIDRQQPEHTSFKTLCRKCTYSTCIWHCFGSKRATAWLRGSCCRCSQLTEANCPTAKIDTSNFLQGPQREWETIRKCERYKVQQALSFPDWNHVPPGRCPPFTRTSKLKSRRWRQLTELAEGYARCCAEANICPKHYETTEVTKAVSA